MSKVSAFRRRAASLDGATGSGGGDQGSTEPPSLDDATITRMAWLRRAGTALLFLFVLLGAASVFGVRDADVSATGGGYELTVHHAEVTRPGLDTPWSARVVKRGGFDGPVELRTTASYWELFDENGLSPDPAATRLDGKYLVMEFDEPSADELVVSWDARVSPAVQGGARAETSVIEDGEPAVSVSYRTRVMP